MATQTNRLTEESLAVLEDFRKQPNVEDEHYQTIISVINASPLLVERFNLAVANKHLTGLKPQDPNTNAGGGFHPDTQEISLPLDSLTADSDKNSMIFVLAHEVQHSFNHKESRDATEQFLQDIQTQAKQQGVRDYTDEIQALIMANRKDEASAEIAGFNAIVSAIKTNQASFNLGDLYDATEYMEDFIALSENNLQDMYTLKSGLILNKDMMLSETAEDLPKNLEAMGKHYFDKDKNETRLGHCEPTGCTPDDFSDYTNYYATWMIGNVIAAERHYNPGSTEPLVLDIQKLKLNEQMLEENGLYVGKQPMPYKDIGKNPPFIGRFDHTYDGAKHHQWIPIAYEKSMPTTAETDPLQARMDAMLDRINRSLEAYRQNDAEAIRAANAEMIAASPAAQKMLAGHDAFTEALRQQQERENSLYSLENMPERAQMLHGWIHEKFTAYVQEHNLPYTERGIQNSVAAITAEAYAKKLSDIDDLVVNNGRLSVKQEGRVVGSYAWVDADKAASTPERESFKETLLAEQNLAREAEQREMARQAEQSRGMGMSR